VRAWIQKRIPVGRPGEVSEVARLVGSLFVERITFLTGETIYIDGAQGMNH
jgi:NAD(P)-dependent dehydrogenase (short-subunit alcohol dehydrogenase family)